MAGRTTPLGSVEMAQHLMIMRARHGWLPIAAVPTPFGVSWPDPGINAFTIKYVCERRIVPPSMPPAGYRIPRHRRLIHTNAINRFAP